jgi:hypothetical protein
VICSHLATIQEQMRVRSDKDCPTLCLLDQQIPKRLLESRLKPSIRINLSESVGQCADDWHEGAKSRALEVSRNILELDRLRRPQPKTRESESRQKDLQLLKLPFKIGVIQEQPCELAALRTGVLLVAQGLTAP